MTTVRGATRCPRLLNLTARSDDGRAEITLHCSKRRGHRGQHAFGAKREIGSRR